MIVYTDAPAKDVSLEDDLLVIADSKNIKVSTILTEPVCVARKRRSAGKI